MKPYLQPKRKIEGIAAMFLSFDGKGEPDWEAFEQHLLRTTKAGLQAAVNMDTGFGPQLTATVRREVLKRTRAALGESSFVAGAMPFGEEGGYESAIASILEVGAMPILFQSDLFVEATGKEVATLYETLLRPAPKALAFELGSMFAPFGRIYDTDIFRRILEIPNIVGLKHSSLSRELEWERLGMRDKMRPDFKIYTGNDLAIDMVCYGSDYLLGLATFDPVAFAQRDRWWAEGDDRFQSLNAALQAVGTFAFRDPVPAYKDSAAIYLDLTGQIKGARPHRDCPRRPVSEKKMLALRADLVRQAIAKPSSGR